MLFIQETPKFLPQGMKMWCSNDKKPIVLYKWFYPAKSIICVWYFCRTLRNFFGGSKSLDGNRVSGIYELFLRRASESGSPGICVPHHTCPCQCVLHFSPCVIEPTVRLSYFGFWISVVVFLVWKYMFKKRKYCYLSVCSPVIIYKYSWTSLSQTLISRIQ